MKINAAVIALVLAASPNLVSAEVIDSASSGFTVKTTLTIGASPDDVYRRLIRNVGDWWDPAHTYSGNSHNLSIEEKPMGCFCEKLPNQGGVPIKVDGKTIGAIACSGAPSEVDEAIAQAAVDALLK